MKATDPEFAGMHHDEILKHFAGIKASIKKMGGVTVPPTRQQIEWDSVPLIHEDATIGHVVKDIRIDSVGHVGIVDDVSVITKRDGRTAVVVSFRFVNHTTLNQSRTDIRTRKVEFILNNNNQ